MPGGRDLGSANAELPSQSCDFKRKAARFLQCHVARSDRRSVGHLGPNERTLQVAAGYARGSSLGAIEGLGTPVSEWARATGAIDLLGGSATEALQPELTRH